MAISNSQEMDRVRRHTPSDINHLIDSQINSNLQHYTSLSNEEISKRIDELDKEWEPHKKHVTASQKAR